MSAPPRDFQELYAAEIGYVVRTLQRLGAAASDLEDLAQEVFLVAYRLRAERDPARPARPWLFAIAYRTLANYRRKAHRRREVVTEAEPVATRPSPEEVAGDEERRAILLRALATLDLEHRAVAVLHDLEGMPAPAIAELLGIPLNTVYSRARNARQKLLDATRGLRGAKR